MAKKRKGNKAGLKKAHCVLYNMSDGMTKKNARKKCGVKGH